MLVELIAYKTRQKRDSYQFDLFKLVEDENRRIISPLITFTILWIILALVYKLCASVINLLMVPRNIQ